MRGEFKNGNKVIVFDKTSEFCDKAGTVVSCIRPGIYSVKFNDDDKDASKESVIWMMAYQIALVR